MGAVESASFLRLAWFACGEMGVEVCRRCEAHSAEGALGGGHVESQRVGKNPAAATHKKRLLCGHFTRTKEGYSSRMCDGSASYGRSACLEVERSAVAVGQAARHDSHLQLRGADQNSNEDVGWRHQDPRQVLKNNCGSGEAVVGQVTRRDRCSAAEVIAGRKKER